jgi:hypothetical protein
MRTPYRIAAVFVVVIPAANWAYQHRSRPDPRLLPDSAVDRTQTASNILPDDYLGPETCKSCHARNYRLWKEHPHRRMNQDAGPDSVRGDFADHVLRLPTGEARFTTEEGGYQVTARRADGGVRRWQVTRTVGTRYMQFYIGVETDGPEPADHLARKEHMIPFAWWVSLGRWLPKSYFDADGPEDLGADGLPRAEGLDSFKDVRPWTGVCMSCHNTAPYAYRAVHRLYAGFPDTTVSLAVGPLSAALSPTVAAEPTIASFEQINMRLDPAEHLVTLGISCESCHFGGREHALQGDKIHFLPTSPFLRLTAHRADRPLTDDRKNPATLTGICTQCHSGNSLFYPNGCAETNSREGLDFNLGACSSQMTCVHCHEPHTAGPMEGGPTQAAHVAACVRCHPQYADEGRAAAHARHDAAAGVTCLDCHMPRQVIGLDGLVRTHRVGMPVEESMVANGVANACNLCHLDRSVRWTLEELEQGWGRRLTPDAKWPSFADLDRPVGDVWLGGAHNGMRCVASLSYARSPLGKSRLPDLVAALNDPEPINRVFHAKAVEALRGRKLSRQEYEVTAPPAVRARQIERLLSEGPPAR